MAVEVPPSPRLEVAMAWLLREDTATAMESAVKNLATRREKIREHTFMTWKTVCAGFLQDILHHASA